MKHRNSTHRIVRFQSGSQLKKPQSCILCGCTQYHACPGGCSWVLPNLCSRCADEMLQTVACPDCVFPRLAEKCSMCFDCEHITCAHTCAWGAEAGNDEPEIVVDSQNPSCEMWSCKHSKQCLDALVAGFAIRDNLSGYRSVLNGTC